LDDLAWECAVSKAGRRQILWAAAVSAALVWPALADEAPSAIGSPRQVLASVAPDSKATLDLAYDLRFWFIPFGHTTYRGIFAESTYQATSYFKTSGLVSVFWKAEINAGASGNVEKHGVSPYVYDSYAIRSSDKKQRVKLSYDHKGPPKLTAVPTYNTTKYPVTPEQQEEGVDPMSAVTLIVSGLSADAKNPCGTVAPVFDGRRRYDVEFTFVTDQTVKLENGLYNGPAHLCRIRYRQIAGYDQEIISGKKDKWPALYGLVADIPAPGAPEGHYLVPLKLWADTSFGTVTAELSNLRTVSPGTKG